jgi:hypothetical protein
MLILDPAPKTSLTEKKEEVKTGIQDATIDIGGKLEELIKDPKSVLSVLTNTLKEAFAPSKYIEATKSLNEEAFRLARTLGVSSQRTRELTVAVADAIPEFVGIGLEVADAGLAMSTLFESLNTNLTIGKDVLVDFAATSKVTGVEQKTLAVNFRDVGVGIASIGDKMMEVTKIAQQAGVSVKSVSDSVVSNLDKMNMYNFDGGIKGLAKMAAQASKLGMSMEGVFGIVDKVFNPEGAINLAASLQRLGVTTSDLLDPLRLMDLAQNDPAELQNQIVNMTKEFTRFNKETNQFEILPGAKRRLNEIGKELGYNNGELQKMAINAGNFDYKLKQIRMPNLPINEDTKNLIATMAQINKEGIAEIRVARTDNQGNFTGEYDPVAVQNLTEQQIKLVEQQQLSQQDSMPDIAKDQLDELRKLNTNINKFVMAQRYGLASSNLFSGAYVSSLRMATKGFEDSKFGSEPATTSKTYRDNIGLMGNNSIKDIMNMTGDKLFDIGTKIFNNGIKLTTTDLKNQFQSIVDGVTKIYTTPANDVDFVKNFNDFYTNSNMEKKVNHSGNINYTFTHDFKLSDISKLPTQMQQLIIDLWSKGLTETEIQNLMMDAKNKVFNGNNQPTIIKKTP